MTTILLAPCRPADGASARYQRRCVHFGGAAGGSLQSRLSTGDAHPRRARAGVRVIRDAAPEHVLLQGDEGVRVRPRRDRLACAADARAAHCGPFDMRSLTRPFGWSSPLPSASCEGPSHLLAPSFAPAMRRVLGLLVDGSIGGSPCTLLVNP